MRFLSNKISLLINPSETDHANLILSIKELESHCIGGDPGDRKKELLLQALCANISETLSPQ